MKKQNDATETPLALNRVVSSSKTWEDIHIAKLEDGKQIQFTEGIPNTTIKKGDIYKVVTYSVWNAIENACMSFDNRSRKCYDIPYGTFVVL